MPTSRRTVVRVYSWHFRLQQTLACLFALICSATVMASPTPKSIALEVLGDTPSYSIGPTGSKAEQAWWQELKDPRLQQWIAQALNDNPSLQAAWERVRLAESAAMQQGSALLPSAQVSAGGYRNSTEGLLQQLAWQTGGSISQEVIDYLGEQYQTAQWSLSATWGIDLFGRNTALWLASRWDKKAAEGSRVAQSMAVAHQVAAAYYDWIAASEVHRFIEKQVLAQSELMALSRSSYEGGDISSLDLHLQEQQLAASQAALPASKNQVRAAKGRLATLLGKPISVLRNEELQAESQLPDPPPFLGLGSPLSLLETRPDLLAASAQVHAAHLRRISAWSNLFPQLALSASTGAAGQQIGADADWQSAGTWSIGLSASLSLFSGGRNWATAKGANAGYRAASFDLQNALLAAVRDVEDAWGTLDQLNKETAALQRQVVAARSAYEESRSLYQSGVLPYLTLLTSEQVLQQAEIGLVTSRRNRLSAYIYLHDALGSTWAIDASRKTPIDTPEKP